MVKKRLKIITLLLLLLFTHPFSQQDPIDSKKSELAKIKSELADLEKDFESKSRKEKESITAYENINRQSYLLNKLIASIRIDERNKQSQINLTVKKIRQIEEEIEALKQNYEKYVVTTYKYGKYNELENLLDAETLKQAVLRVEYLKRFSDQRKIDLYNFESNKSELISAKAKLEIEKRELDQLLREKDQEEKSLDKALSEKKSIVDKIKKDKKNLSKLIVEKRKSEQQIKDLITKLVEEAERKRKEKGQRNTDLASKNKNVDEDLIANEYNLDLRTSSFSSFTELKGNLIWPVAKGKVVRKFGQSKNPALNTITVNYGIDIQISGDKGVKAVAEGVVSAIDWIPGYGTVIIISHKGDFRTVYGHLSEVLVSEGDKVKSGSLIARIGESLEGNILHFEIWNSRSNVNPEDWLKK